MIRTVLNGALALGQQLFTPAGGKMKRPGTAVTRFKFLKVALAGVLGILAIPLFLNAPADATSSCSTNNISGTTWQELCNYSPLAISQGTYSGVIAWNYKDSKINAQVGEITGKVTDTSANGYCVTAKVGHSDTITGTVTWLPEGKACGKDSYFKLDVNLNKSSVGSTYTGYFFYDICQPASKCAVVWSQWIPENHPS